MIVFKHFLENLVTGSAPSPLVTLSLALRFKKKNCIIPDTGHECLQAAGLLSVKWQDRAFSRNKLRGSNIVFCKVIHNEAVAYWKKNILRTHFVNTHTKKQIFGQTIFSIFDLMPGRCHLSCMWRPKYPSQRFFRTLTIEKNKFQDLFLCHAYLPLLRYKIYFYVTRSYHCYGRPFISMSRVVTIVTDGH